MTKKFSPRFLRSFTSVFFKNLHLELASKFLSISRKINTHCKNTINTILFIVYNRIPTLILDFFIKLNHTNIKSTNKIMYI